MVGIIIVNTISDFITLYLHRCANVLKTCIQFMHPCKSRISEIFLCFHRNLFKDIPRGQQPEITLNRSDLGKMWSREPFS